MQYLTLIYEHAGSVENQPEDQHQLLIKQHIELQEMAIAEKAFVGCSQLSPSATAVSVRIRNESPLITDGPFAESKELLVGYYCFECAELDAALKWAGKIPLVSNAAVEIRPIDNVECGANAKSLPADIKVTDNKSLFALLNFLDEELLEAYSDEEMSLLIKKNTAMAEAAQRAQEYLGGNKLFSSAATTHIKHNDGQQQVMDGPYSEAKEVLLGLHIVTCQSIEQAIEYAKSLPETKLGVVEVRPIAYHEQQGLKWNRPG